MTQRTPWQLLTTELQQFVTANKPKSILIFQQAELSVALTNLEGTEVVVYEQWADYLEQTSASEKFELAVVVCNEQSCGEALFSHLIARLRDIDCNQLLLAGSLHHEALEKQHDTYFRALGFKRLRMYASQTKSQPSAYLYYFNLYDYKETPDWLNERFWANPAMWDKARW